MWIRDVDVPEALIDAHRSGKLVIFVGAGASRASPSDLPDFRALTAAIAADANVTVTDTELDTPDVLLGELEDRHEVDVHVRVAARIGVQSSQPNRLHEAIADLATAGPPVRIVTTNYDTHLSTVFAARGLSLMEYRAPAMPMGDDFTGLVYLHGCLRQAPRELVVTDVDFGRGYLRDAWATRFLERMFTTYTVLFIGYSHSDVVMSYLARGLGPTSARYLLTSTPDEPDWRRLRIQPVSYPMVNGSHEPVVEAIAGWASWASMGLLGHRQRVAQLLLAAPPQVPEEASYLEAVVADGEKTKFFVEFARGSDWLSWAAHRPEFRSLFDPSAGMSDSTWPLAYWFAEHYVMSEDLNSAALSVVRDSGNRLGPALWSAIGHRLHMRNTPRPAWLGPWLVLLVQNAPEMGTDWLDYALIASRWPDDRTAALLLFDHLTEPQAVFQSSFGLEGEPRFEVSVRGDGHWLREAWEKVFVPNLRAIATEVLVVVDRHLRRAYQLLTVSGTIRSTWDPLSFSRSAIDPHMQDSIVEPVDILIDAARDCIEVLLDAGSDVAPSYLNAWAATEVQLLRRLAVHGWAHRGDLDATAKVQWLLDKEWLFENQLRHEVFRLIETTLATAAPDVANALVTIAIAGPANDGEFRDYEIYNVLSWIVRHAPHLKMAVDALEQARAHHPDFQERDHPDLIAWSESGTFGPQPPMTPEALHDQVTSNPSLAVAELRDYEQATSPFDGPTWQDALGVLAKAVSKWPSDGFLILGAAGGDHRDVQGAVVRGWAAAQVADDAATLILDGIGAMDLAVVGDDVAGMLAGRGRREASPTEWHRMPASRILASRVWTTINDAEVPTQVDDWLSRAINHPVGWLTQFWAEVVAAEWRGAGDSWSGLPAPIRDQLELLLTGEREKAAMAEVIVASRVHFFFAADRGWCEEWVLPLLDWSNLERAKRCWDGFLYWGRWNDPMLEAGLLAQYLAAADHIGEFKEEFRRQLCQHFAAIALHSELDPLVTGWMRGLTVTVEPGVRVVWMEQIAWLLERLPVDAVEYQWQRWMRPYWQDRLESVPVQLTIDEASAMARWVVYLADSVAEGVALVVGNPARLAEHSNLVRDLTEERVARAPKEMADLLAHLLRGTQPPFYDCHGLSKTVALLRDQPTPTDTTPIVEQAIRLGCDDAPTW